MNERLRIEEPEVKRDGSGTIVRANIVFGPHHFFEVFVEDGAVQCAFGATHHGVRADASEVPSDFEQLVNELAQNHPDKAF